MNEEIKNSIKEEQIVVDTVWAYNEYAKPVVDWTSARWMDCYELSAGWTIGVSIVLGLWILGKILPDSDGESAPAPRRARAAAPAPAPTRNNVSAPAKPATVWKTAEPRKPRTKVEPKPQRTYEVKFIHISNPKTVHTLNCMVRANGMTEARMMVENNETSIPFTSMNEIVSMRKR